MNGTPIWPIRPTDDDVIRSLKEERDNARRAGAVVMGGLVALGFLCAVLAFLLTPILYSRAVEAERERDELQRYANTCLIDHLGWTPGYKHGLTGPIPPEPKGKQ